MRASRTYGSMRGAPSNGRPYRNCGDTLRSRAPRPSPGALAYCLGGDSGSPSGALPFAWSSPKAIIRPADARERVSLAGRPLNRQCRGAILGRPRARPTRQSLQKIATNGSRPPSSISPSVSFS